MKKASTEERLAPCPFCGGIDLDVYAEDMESEGYWSGYVHCHHCEVDGPRPRVACIDAAEAKQESAKSWNTRTPSDQALRESLEAARNWIEHEHTKLCLYPAAQKPSSDLLRKIDAALISPPASPGGGLRTANVERQKEWDPENIVSLSFRGVELAGEVGEACNVIKKLERERYGMRGSRATIEQLAEELADVIICADLVAIQAGIDLMGDAVPKKFNASSEKLGLKTRMPTPPSRETNEAGE